MNRKMIEGYAYSAAGAALFSTKAIFIKLAYQEQANAALLLALRMAFSLPFYIAVGAYAVLENADEKRSFAAGTDMGAGLHGRACRLLSVVAAGL